MLLQAQTSRDGRMDRPESDDAVGGPEGACSWYVPCKIVLEFTAAACLLVLAAPVILLCMALIKLTSRGPAIYVQTRLGRFGRPYRIYKLRTMTDNCESKSGPKWATAYDPRITALGRFLRRTHLDELPQLWNVLQGDMSLVGPRPERPEFVPELEKAIPHYRRRLLVRPGVTGLAQIQLPADTDVESVRRKLAYDLFYVRQVNFWLDARIVLGTLFKVVGLPFPVLRVLFLMPPLEVIEDAYRSLPAQGSVVPARLAWTTTANER